MRIPDALVAWLKARAATETRANGGKLVTMSDVVLFAIRNERKGHRGA